MGTLGSLALAASLLGLPSSGLSTTQSAGTVRGDVLDENGQTVPGARIIMTPLTVGGAALRIDAGRDGRFSRADVDAGLYAMSAVQGELGSEEHRVRVRAGRTVEVRFVLRPGIHRTVLARADDGDEFSDTFESGVVANRDGAYRDAAFYFERAAELNPRCLECRYNAGVAYATLEAWADAEQAFSAALALDGGYAAAYYGLSMVYTRSGRPDEAAAARTEANRLALASLAVRRQHTADDVTRGTTFYNAGAFGDARRLFERAIAESPNYAPAHFWLGMTLARLEDDSGPAAASALRRYLSLEPAGEHAASARATLAELGL